MVKPPAEERSEPRPWLWWAKLAFRILVFVLVVGGIVYTVRNSLAELDKPENRHFSLADVDGWWLAAAGGIYLVGLIPWWLFWHQTLRALKQQPRLWDSFVAYYISQLGKYLPGKALVIVVRTDYVRGPKVDTTVAATSVFVETLMMMAVGALLSAIIIVVLFRDKTWLLLLALGLMVGVGLPTVPPIFRRLVRILQVRRANPKIDEALAGLDYRLMLKGWPSLVCGWCLLGLSLWATLHAMPDTAEKLSDHARVLPLLVACVALATVAGFASFMPGGLVVRELVVANLLAATFNDLTAAISAILLRLVWLLAEIIVSIILYLIGLATRR